MTDSVREAPPINLDEVWYLALHCRMFLHSHAELERLGLMDTGGLATDPVEANYHQFAAMHLLSTLTVVDKGQGYVDHGLKSLGLSGLATDVRAIVETVIYSEVTFGAALKAHRDHDRTHGNIFAPARSINRPAQKETRRAYDAANVAIGREAFNACWLRMRDAIEQLATRLDQELEKLAPPQPSHGSLVLHEVLPRQGGPLGMHRPPRFVYLDLNPPGAREFIDWQLSRTADKSTKSDSTIPNSDGAE